jgi:hypothetical protein
MSTTYGEVYCWGVTVAQLTPSYDEFTIEVATYSGNVSTMALEYFQGLYPANTFRVELIKNLGIPVITD